MNFGCNPETKSRNINGYQKMAEMIDDYKLISLFDYIMAVVVFGTERKILYSMRVNVS